MGAVQKLATVVIVGLTALATLLVLYLADEDNRRESEAEEQEHVAIERGIDTYIANCLTCHGPAGEGVVAEPARPGAPIGGNTEATLINQTDDPVLRAERETFIRRRIHGGQPIGCSDNCIMPPWGQEYGGELNDEQIEELVLMIQNVDWDLVFNEAVHEFDTYANLPPAPPSDDPTTQQTAGVAPGLPQVTLEAVDIAWNQTTLEAAPGQTISLVNLGQAPHNFSIDAINVDVDMPPGETMEWQVPEDLQPGQTYEYYCDVPGHEQLMRGTLTIVEPPASPGPAAAGAGTPVAGTPGASPAASEATPESHSASPEASPVAQIPNAVLVSIRDRRIEQQQITAVPGQIVEIVNVDPTAHNFSVDELGANIEIPAGQTVIWLVPDNAPVGMTFRVYSTVPGDEQMTSQLTIGDPAATPAASPAASSGNWTVASAVLLPTAGAGLLILRRRRTA